VGYLEFGPAQTGSCCSGKICAFASCGCEKTTTIGTRRSPDRGRWTAGRSRILAENGIAGVEGNIAEVSDIFALQGDDRMRELEARFLR